MLIELLIVVVIVGVLAALVAGKFRQFSSQSRCLAHGYPRRGWVDDTPVCIRSINGTDEVVPLQTLERK